MLFAPLDVFSVKKGDPLWLSSAETTEQALAVAIRNGEGLYLFFRQQTGDKEYYRITADGTIQQAAAA